jgi:hypothetical protein
MTVFSCIAFLKQCAIEPFFAILLTAADNYIPKQ